MRRRSLRTVAAALLVTAVLGPASSVALGAPRPAIHHNGQWGKQPSNRRHLTQCTAVAHVGDSTTVESKDQQHAAYAQYFGEVIVDGGGGRAVLQTIPSDRHTGIGAVDAIKAIGFGGCWVVALGTNDAANIAAGANYSAGRVIDKMLTAIDPTATTPVAWVEVFTTKSSGYWRQSNMAAWNQALYDATGRWPNLKIMRWTAEVSGHTDWLSDGIHHTAQGRSERTTWIAVTAYHELND